MVLGDSPTSDHMARIREVQRHTSQETWVVGVEMADGTAHSSSIACDPFLSPYTFFYKQMHFRVRVDFA